MPENNIIRGHRIFRVLLQGMSHPGKVYALPDWAETSHTIVEILDCLIDHEVGITVIGDPGLATEIVGRTNARLVSLEDADFVIVCNGGIGGRLKEVKRGSLAYPHTGATIVYLVDSLGESDGGYVLTGPGIPDKVSLRIEGILPRELHHLKSVNCEFPLGVDAAFLDRSRQITWIPRSSQIGEI